MRFSGSGKLCSEALFYSAHKLSTHSPAYTPAHKRRLFEPGIFTVRRIDGPVHHWDKLIQRISQLIVMA